MLAANMFHINKEFAVEFGISWFFFVLFFTIKGDDKAKQEEGNFKFFWQR